jgi:hypothetical protein
VGIALTLSLSSSLLFASSYACAPPPSPCDPDVLSYASTQCNGLLRWEILGPVPSTPWWNCDGSGDCPSDPAAPGQCNVMTVKYFDVVYLTCGSETRACVTGGSTGGFDPNRTCDNTPCYPDKVSFGIPTLVPDACSSPWAVVNLPVPCNAIGAGGS